MTIEAPSGYTVVGAHITTDSTRFTYTAVSRVSDEYAYYDFGAGYFSTRFYMEGQFQITGSSGASPKSVAYGYTDTLDDASATTNQCGGMHRVDGAGTLLVDYALLREGGVSAAIGGFISLAFSTTHYFRTGLYSGLGGQYGLIVTQIFSDAGRTTLLETITSTRTTAATYRYVIFGQSYTTGSAMTITGYDENITLYSSIAGAVLTAGTETDPNTKIVPYADCIQATGLSISTSINGATHTAHDYGAGFFTDYKISGILNITSFTNGVSANMFAILNVTDAAADALAANDLQGLVVEWLSSTTYALKMHQAVAGTDSYSTVSSTLSTNRPYAATLERSGTTLTLKVWNDLELDVNLQGTSQVGSTVTWTGRETTAYRYLMPVSSCCVGTTDRNSTFTIGGVKLPASVSSYSITSAGGAVSGGSSTIKIGQKVLASGGMVSGGSSTILLGQKVLSTGGGVLGGIATQYGTYAGTASYSITSAGGMVAGGSSTINLGLKLLSTGGMVMGGSATISVAYAPGLSEYIYTEPVVDSTGTPITGASSKTTIFLKDIDTGDIMDWSDVTMKSSGWVSITDVLSEAIYPAGEYGYDVPLSGLANGRYCATLKYTPTTPSSSDPIQTFQIEFYVVSGYVVDQYVSNRLDMTITALPAAVLSAAQTTPIHADVKKMNAATVTGNGTSGDLWRGA